MNSYSVSNSQFKMANFSDELFYIIKKKRWINNHAEVIGKKTPS